MHVPAPPPDAPDNRQFNVFLRIPLFAQVMIACFLGTLLALVFDDRPYLPRGSFGNAQLGDLTMLVTTMLKALAGPLVFFAVLDAFIRTEITWERCRRLLMFSALNVTVAMLIGLCVMNLWKPGESWTEQLQTASDVDRRPAISGKAASESSVPSLSLVDSVSRMIPPDVVSPFGDGNLMRLIVLAVLIGAGFRAIRREQIASGECSYEAFDYVIGAMFQILMRVLEWIVRLVPLAVCGAIAKSVSETGPEVFRIVGVFLVAMLVGLFAHSFGYYTLVAWWYGGKRPRLFLGKGMEAVVTGLSTNSSLATVPVTLRVLTEEMGVSDQSARLSTCVGTNFNNDGITLYEAMTAIFLAQATGLQLSLSQQFVVVLTAVLASLGAAGIPHGGLAVLPLVLASTGLSSQTIATAMPLILTVDWIIARCRSGVNVMGDMTVAIQLDRSSPKIVTH